MYADITSTPLEFYRSPQTSDLGSLSRRSEQDALTRMSRLIPILFDDPFLSLHSFPTTPQVNRREGWGISCIRDGNLANSSPYWTQAAALLQRTRSVFQTSG